MGAQVAHRSIEDVLTRDHERIDAVFSRLTAALKEGSPRAGAPLRELLKHLGYHMQWEEEVLFPAARDIPRISQRGIESLLIDHGRIRDTLSWLQSEVEAGHFESARVVMDSLRVFLIGHNRDEEHGIYAEADRYFPEERKKTVMEAFRPEP